MGRSGEFKGDRSREKTGDCATHCKGDMNKFSGTCQKYVSMSGWCGDENDAGVPGYRNWLDIIQADQYYNCKHCASPPPTG
jgi:hypothetical protein